jgi:hypothetical protein
MAGRLFHLEKTMPWSEEAKAAVIAVELAAFSTADLFTELQRRGGPEAELAMAGLLALRKAADYNAGQARDSYFPLGLASYAAMIHVKSQRLLSFARSPREALNEPVMDTLHDMINYASFAADWMRRTA